MNGHDHASIIQELNRTRDELIQARLKHDEELSRKLSKLEAGQEKMLGKISEIELSYVTVQKLESVEKRVSFHDKVIWIGIGAIGLIKMLEPLVSHFLK